MRTDDPFVISKCVVKNKDDIHEFTIKTCSLCFTNIIQHGRDEQDRITFPYDKQVKLYKVKTYLHPPIKRKKGLESWKLFSPLKTKGKKAEYS